MGFLINLPAPCNLLYQPNPSAEEGIVKYLFNILKIGMKTSIKAKLCNLVESYEQTFTFLEIRTLFWICYALKLDLAVTGKF